MPLEIWRFFPDFSWFSVLNKSSILQWENEINSRGRRFFDKILNKSCILQWENVVELFLESGDFVSCRVPLEISLFFLRFSIQPRDSTTKQYQRRAINFPKWYHCGICMASRLISCSIWCWTVKEEPSIQGAIGGAIDSSNPETSRMSRDSMNRWLLAPPWMFSPYQTKQTTFTSASILSSISLFFLFFYLILPMFLSLFYHCYRDKLKAR